MVLRLLVGLVEESRLEGRDGIPWGACERGRGEEESGEGEREKEVRENARFVGFSWSPSRGIQKKRV